MRIGDRRRELRVWTQRRLRTPFDALTAPRAEPRHVELPARAGACLSVGRSSRCDAVLADLSVSRKHLEITYDGDRWQLWDQASTNGTFLHGRRVIAADVLPGDVLRVGGAFIALDAPREPPA